MRHYCPRPDLPLFPGRYVMQCKTCSHEFEVKPDETVDPCFKYAFLPNERPDNPSPRCGGEHKRIR